MTGRENRRYKPIDETMNPRTLPASDSTQNLARFWDTHDLADFEDELEVVDEPIFAQTKTLTLRLESDEAEAVRRIAESKGVAEVDLIREWVQEKISIS